MVQSLHIHVASVRLVALANAFVVARHCARGNAHAMQPESRWGKGPKMGMLMGEGVLKWKIYIYKYINIYRYVNRYIYIYLQICARDAILLCMYFNTYIHINKELCRYRIKLYAICTTVSCFNRNATSAHQSMQMHSLACE